MVINIYCFIALALITVVGIFRFFIFSSSVDETSSSSIGVFIISCSLCIIGTLFATEKEGYVKEYGDYFVRYGEYTAIPIKNIDKIYLQEDLDYVTRNEEKKYVLVVSEQKVLVKLINRLTDEGMIEEDKEIKITGEVMYEKE